MGENLLLKQIVGSPWVYDSVEKTYTLTIDNIVVVIIDAAGNLKIKGRVLTLP